LDFFEDKQANVVVVALTYGDLLLESLREIARQADIHMNLMTKERKYLGGHIEEGCAVLALSEISILRLPALRLERRRVDETKIAHLRPA